MNSFNIADFLTQQGHVMLAGSYSETVSGSQVTATIIGAPTNLSEKGCFKYTFYMFRMPLADGEDYTWLSCFKREKAVVNFSFPPSICCGVVKTWVSTVS